MPKVRANGIDIEHQWVGAPDGAPLVLINGLGEQLIRWSPALLARMGERGYRVLIFDNRDAGLSTHFDGVSVDLAAVTAAYAAGKRAEVPYLLDDMAGDAFGLIAVLGLARVHVVGVSMGGMIAQQLAAIAPERVASLTSIMSTTGNPAVPPPTPEAAAVLFGPRPDPRTDREAYVEHSQKIWRTIAGPDYPPDEAEVRARVLASADRAYDPAGFTRQIAAVYASGDRRASLHKITAPTVVVHGEKDPLVNVEGGRDTAANIKGAELRIIPGMGHDLPPPLWDQVLDAIDLAASRGPLAR
ncbi:MAG TPA: alpha/beta hydrolase [Caulobacteraceae bacterium]|jgi:pimeloyl-ACP methyl ester carboxylesterase